MYSCCLLPIAYYREKDRDRVRDDDDLKWRFPKVTEELGVYRDFMTIPEKEPIVS